jgi:Protein involved in formate dehydrogenase formation
MGLDLREPWEDLLRRRVTLRGALAVYGEIVELWARWSPPRELGLALSAAACRARWEQGTPLVEEAARALQPDDVEDLVGGAMEVLAGADPGLAPALQRFAQAWDRGALTPHALLPARGRLGSGAAEKASGLATDGVAFLAVAGLRPALQAMFAAAHEHATEGCWSLGVCPFCGGPPGFTDVIEDGRRRLACHLCGGAWLFAKLRCPFCGVEGADTLIRLTPDEAREEGYLVWACRQCRAYLKEVDRRARWNAGPAIIEDWGSPHFDLVAHRQGYWRAVPSIVQLAQRG